MGKTGNKSNSMKIYRDEKMHSLQRMILLIESFSNVKRFSFETFIRACELLNVAKKKK